MATDRLFTHPVLFTSGGSSIVGRAYRNSDDLTERQPGVLVSGSWLTVKEQMAGLYAKALARRGYTAITFDFSGWGESGGGLRLVELPDRKIADIIAAARFASTLSFVQPGGVSYVGVCATAQYALAAVAHGAPITSYASVAGWFHDTTSVAPFYGGTEGVNRRLHAAEKALDVYRRTGELVTVPAYDPADERAGMTLEMDYYANPARGAVPEWPNRMAEMSWVPWLSFDGLSPAAAVSVPSLFVHADGCVFPEHIERLRQSMTGPVEVAWGDGAQTDFYDQPAQVEFAIDALDAHLSGMRTVRA